MQALYRKRKTCWELVYCNCFFMLSIILKWSMNNRYEIEKKNELKNYNTIIPCRPFNERKNTSWKLVYCNCFSMLSINLKLSINIRYIKLKKLINYNSLPSFHVGPLPKKIRELAYSYCNCFLMISIILKLPMNIRYKMKKKIWKITILSFHAKAFIEPKNCWELVYCNCFAMISVILKLSMNIRYEIERKKNELRNYNTIILSKSL